MTENPAQGASPENREPATPNEGDPGHPQAAPAPDSAHGNPTLRLDRAADNPPQPVYPQHQPSYGRPPATETQQFGARPEHGQQGQTPGQPGPQPTPGYGQPAGNSAFGQSQQAPGQHGNPQYAQGPYGQHQQGGYGGNQPGSPYASNPAHAPKRKAAFGVPTLVASILAAGLVGGGVVAGATQLLEDPAVMSTGSGSSSQAGPVIVNNREDVNAITAAAVKATPSVVTIKASSGSEGGTGSGIILDGEGHVLTNTHVVTL
ncbi:MAG TPA: signal protein PDZ, partial [Arthrobacter sp.]|nr:signal protein PDZ [Arthrobacter sp.]